MEDDCRAPHDIGFDIIGFKPLVWIGDSLECVRSFAAAARKKIGLELWEIQQGRLPSDWKPMSPVGPGVRELRVHSERAYRVIYVATLPEAVYVLHAFVKQSRKAPKSDVRDGAQSVQGLDSGERQAMSSKLKRTRGSGNVFADVGFSPEEADNLLLRAQLMSQIRDVARGVTQREAAALFNVSQPRLNDVLRGKIDKFSLDALVNMLGKAGMRVEFRVRPSTNELVNKLRERDAY